MTKILVVMVLFLACSNSYAGMLCYKYKYAPNLVASVQSLLQQQGFYNGPVDGMWGPKTREAVRKYQVSKGIKIPLHRRPTLDTDQGELESRTLQAMFGDDAPKEGVSRIENPHNAPSDHWEEVCR